jgi:hypothetical protein
MIISEKKEHNTQQVWEFEVKLYKPVRSKQVKNISKNFKSYNRNSQIIRDKLLVFKTVHIAGRINSLINKLSFLEMSRDYYLDDRVFETNQWKCSKKKSVPIKMKSVS